MFTIHARHRENQRVVEFVHAMRGTEPYRLDPPTAELPRIVATTAALLGPDPATEPLVTTAPWWALVGAFVATVTPFAVFLSIAR